MDVICVLLLEHVSAVRLLGVSYLGNPTSITRTTAKWSCVLISVLIGCRTHMSMIQICW